MAFKQYSWDVRAADVFLTTRTQAKNPQWLTLLRKLAEPKQTRNTRISLSEFWPYKSRKSLKGIKIKRSSSNNFQPVTRCQPEPLCFCRGGAAQTDGAYRCAVSVTFLWFVFFGILIAWQAQRSGHVGFRLGASSPQLAPICESPTGFWEKVKFLDLYCSNTNRTVTYKVFKAQWNTCLLWED